MVAGQFKEAWVEKNKQDLTVLPWHATDAVTPSPGRSATEDLVQGEVGHLAGVPEAHLSGRTAFIYRPAVAASTNGTHRSRHWCLEFEARERWTNQLMGYQSSADPLGRHQMEFETREAAVAFAEKMGWAHEVQEANEVTSLHGTKGYYQNFLNYHVERRQKAQTPARFARGQFAHEERGVTAFVNLEHTKWGASESKMVSGTHWKNEEHPNNHSASWRHNNLTRKQELARKLGK